MTDSSSTAATIGVVRERAPGERRVALVPEVVAGLCRAGLRIVVEAGAGAAAWFDDDAYAAAGATVASPEEVFHDAGVIVSVGPPQPQAPLRAGQTLIGLLEPGARLDLVRRWAVRGVTTLSLDGLPRTVSRAQAMDALTSQANVAGYKAAVLAADTFGGFFPMLTTAAGTSRPAAVLVLGTGVAGLQAIGTARRLGAVVSAYDVRPETREEVASLGARFLDLGLATGAGSGGYARALSAHERQAQQDALDEQVARFDVVITTARVPGRRPPVLVTANALKSMRPGCVAVDLAAGPLGGNIEGSVPDATVVTDNGVTLIGAGNLPSAMAPAASRAYARNIAAVLTHLMRDGVPAIDRADEITAALLLTDSGEVVNPDVARLLSKGVS
jgi:H+-translocating NAD(P) transhydrogenase subunit alpha